MRNPGEVEQINRAPHNIKAERVVLGAMMLSEEILGEVLEELEVGHFYLEAHRKIFEAIRNLFNRGERVDAVQVADELQSMGPALFERIGGMAYISDLCDDVTAPSLALDYLKIIKKAAALRDLIRAGQEIIQLGYHPPESDVADILDRAESILYGITNTRIRDRFTHIRELIKETYEYLDSKGPSGQLTGVPTGFRELDRTLLGLQHSDLIIVAARPGMGKTSFVLTLARNVAVEHSLPVGIFSLEMSKIQLAQRLLASEALISSHTLRTGNITSKAERDSLLQAIDKLSRAPIFIDDSPIVSVTDIRTKARRLKNKEDVQLIIVDYLQLMASDSRTENRQQQVSEISRSLKILAKELDVPVIAVSQLSREVEKREDKRPRLSDLRESGSIEQDADVVMFLYSEDYYKKKGADDELKEMDVDVEIAKHRNGPTRTIRLKFLNEFTRFVEPELRETY